MSVCNSEEDIIESFASKMQERYPDCRVVNDVVCKEIRVVQEDLSFSYSYILKLYRSMNW